jgi:hypothetical protein
MTNVDDIPVAYTPPGGWAEMPSPILADCDEPLAEGAPDLRGTWHVVDAEHNGTRLPDDSPIRSHVERIEQAADRVVISAAGIIHDMRADGTFERGVRDVMQTDFTTPIVVAASFEDCVLVLRPEGIEGVEVRRWREGPQMVWQYHSLFTARLEQAPKVSDR